MPGTSDDLHGLPPWPAEARELPEGGLPPRRPVRWFWAFVFSAALAGLAHGMTRLVVAAKVGLPLGPAVAAAAGEAVGTGLIGALLGWLSDSYAEQRKHQRD